MKTNHQILIIGGGTGGIMTAARLLKNDRSLDVAIIEPANTHYYQPAWTLVGAGDYSFKKTAKPMKDVMPKGVTWIKDFATSFDPDHNIVNTKSSGAISYEFLVVAPGLVMAPQLIEGLPEALEKGVACSNYIDPEYTWEVLRNFKGGNAVFTQPTTPIKCGGAPQKIAYLAADYFSKHGLADKTNVVFATPGSVIFGVKPIRETLMKVIGRYGIHFKPFYAPIKIDADKKIIYFKHTDPDENKCMVNEDNILGEKSSPTVDEIIEMPFDMLHLAPPQTAPDFVRNSVLVNESGWLDVDHHSLQHNKFKNIFGLGDVAALPTAKTGAAIRKQVPVVVDNLMKLIKHQAASNKSYNGYSSCPLVTGYGKMTLAEFDYDSNFTPDPKLKRMLVFNSAKEHWRLYMFKKLGLPYLYWKKMLKGQDV
jgi:sulfide:quinone oxidoreductase